MHQQPDEIVAVEVQPEENAAADVVDAARHRAVHRLGVVGVVMFRAGRMQLLVGLLVVGLLEEDVGADAGLLEFAVVLDGGGGDVDVDPADGAVLVLDAVDGLDAFEDVFDRVVLRVLAGFECEPLVPHVLQGDHFGADLILGELLAADVGVRAVIGAVGAAVDAVVREVERSEHHDPVAVELLLDLHGEVADPLIFFGQFAFEEDGGFAVAEPFALLRLFEDGVDQFPVVFVGGGVSERLLDLVVVDEFGRNG